MPNFVEEICEFGKIKNAVTLLTSSDRFLMSRCADVSPRRDNLHDHNEIMATDEDDFTPLSSVAIAGLGLLGVTCRNDPLWVRSVGYCGGQWHVACLLR